MIDVMKRLAELDSKNTNIVKENAQVQECGPMGMMGGMSTPHTPASINMTADSGSELTGMLRDIMQLAGMQQVGSQHLGHEHPPMSLSPEPISAVGPAIAEPVMGPPEPSPVDTMRSVIDKLNPEMDGDDSEDGEELGPFQGDSSDDGDQDDDGDEDQREKADETVDSMPNDPNSAPPADANQYAHQENQPGSGNDSEGKKRQSNLPTATYEALMRQYREFIGEAKKPDFLDLDKDGNKKEPMKAAVKDKKVAEGTCPTCHEDPCECDSHDKETNESLAILKLAGLK